MKNVSIIWQDSEKNIYKYVDEKQTPDWFDIMEQSIGRVAQIIPMAAPPFEIEPAKEKETLSREEKMLMLRAYREHGLSFIMSVGGESLISACGVAPGEKNPLVLAVKEATIEQSDKELQEEEYK